MMVHLEFTSALEMADIVQAVSDHVGRSVGLDEDTLQSVSVAVRECVVNAIRHGNRGDHGKHVFVDFETSARGEEAELLIRVRDEGEGFDPEKLPDPSSDENLLKASGRGIFMARFYMDDVRMRRAAQGGMEVVLIKRVRPGGGDGASARV